MRPARPTPSLPSLPLLAAFTALAPRCARPSCRSAAPGTDATGPDAPRARPNNECEPCADRPFTEIPYVTPARMTPEMDRVWQWFDALSGFTSPRNYCAL